MRTRIELIAAVMLLSPLCWAGDEPSGPPPGKTAQPGSASGGVTEVRSDRRADRRYEEMLEKMRAAVEEIAQLYGNPLFLQVFTNDADRATDLKQRLRVARSGAEIRQELTDLEKRRSETVRGERFHKTVLNEFYRVAFAERSIRISSSCRPTSGCGSTTRGTRIRDAGVTARLRCRPSRQLAARP